MSGDGEGIVIVQSDLRNFYDRVRPALLARKSQSAQTSRVSPLNSSILLKRSSRGAGIREMKRA